MSVMTVVMNKRVTGVLCSAENSLCHEEREASKHEIREEAVMQLSAPTVLGGEGGGSSPCDRAENTEAGPPPSPHAALSFVHTILQLHHTPDEPFVSYVTSTLTASTAAHHTFRTAAVFTYLYFLFGVHVHYNTVAPKFLLMDLQINVCISYFCGIYSNNIVNTHSAKQCLLFVVCGFGTSIIRQMLVQ